MSRLRDAALARAIGVYADCMKDRSYDAATPAAAADLAQSFYAGGDSHAARSREAALAFTDATCQARSAVYEALDRAVNRLAETWIREHERAVLSASTAQRIALVNARRILAGTDEGAEVSGSPGLDRRATRR